LDQNDFANQPSKKLKCLQSGVLDDQLPSQTILSSLISECHDTISSESDNELLASPPLPPKKIENSLTYDHIQQGKLFTYYFSWCYYMNYFASYLFKVYFLNFLHSWGLYID